MKKILLAFLIFSNLSWKKNNKIDIYQKENEFVKAYGHIIREKGDTTIIIDTNGKYVELRNSPLFIKSKK